MTAVFIGLTALFLLVNGAFVASEFSLVAARRSKVESLDRQGQPGAAAGLTMMSRLPFYVAAVQVGVTMMSLLLGAVAEPTIGSLIERGLEALGLPDSVGRAAGLILALSVVIGLHIVIGEMVPRNLALADPERALLLLSRPMVAFARLLSPVVRVISASATWVLARLGIRGDLGAEGAPTTEDFADMIATARREGQLAEVQHRLLSGALRLQRRVVSEVMVPWDRVVAVNDRTSVAEAEAQVLASGQSRLPVVGHGGRVLGFLHAKDLLTLPEAARSRPLPLRTIRAMAVLAPDVALNDAMFGLRQRSQQVALVAADGVPVGLVTLEDLVEQVVGDIRDEYDRTPSPVSVRRRRVPGRVR